MNKLEELAHSYGYETVDDMLEHNILRSVVPAICMETDCDYTTDMEPDQSRGYCECCGSHKVKSCLVLAGII